MRRTDNPFGSPADSYSPYEYKSPSSRSGIVLGTSNEARVTGHTNAPRPQQTSAVATPSPPQNNVPPHSSNSNPLSFTPIDSMGSRQRLRLGEASTADLITHFKTLLPSPPPPDPTSREVEVYLDMSAVRNAESLSLIDGGYCRGIPPTLGPAQSPHHQKFWIHSVSGLRFLEFDVEVDVASSTSTPQSNSCLSPSSSKNIKHHVVRGTIVGFYHPTIPSMSRESAGSGSLDPIPGRVVIWQPRGQNLCSPLDLTRARALTAIRCKHCQGIVPADESAYHMDYAHPERLAMGTSPPPAASVQPQRPQQTIDPFGNSNGLDGRVVSPSTGTPVLFQQPQYLPQQPQQSGPPPLHQYQAASPHHNQTQQQTPPSLSYQPQPQQQLFSPPPQPSSEYQPRPQQGMIPPPSPSAAGNVPYGATQGTTYNVMNLGNPNNNSNSSLSLAGTSHNSYGSNLGGGGGGGQGRNYAVTYTWGGRVLTLQRQTSEVFGEHHALFQTLTRSKKLGEGAQGSVSLCQTPDGKQLVIKDLEFETQQDAQACFKQSMRFTSLRHVHLISYLAGERGTQLDASGAKMTHYVSILMPYYPDGDVQKLIAHGSRLSWQSISSLGLQIATALEYLHKLSTPVVHGDIKPENILLYSNKEQCVLMDLDTARECERPIASSVSQSYMSRSGGGGGFGFDDFNSNHRQQPQELRGTMEWMAPEAASGQPITTQSDIWSLGLVLFAMATLPDFMMFKNPRTGQTSILNDKDWLADDLRWVLNYYLNHAQCPAPLRDVILKMIVPDPRQRYSASRIVEELEDASVAILLQSQQ